MNSDINIEQVKFAKQQLERRILDNIIEFEDLTGLNITVVLTDRDIDTKHTVNITVKTDL